MTKEKMIAVTFYCDIDMKNKLNALTEYYNNKEWYEVCNSGTIRRAISELYEKEKENLTL